MPQAELAIGHLRLEWIGPPGERAARAMQDMGRLLERELPGALAETGPGRLLQRHEAEGEAVVCLERLEFELDIELEADPGAILRSWARGFLEALARAAGSRRTVRFVDRAAHLAAFLVELAAGQVRSPWFTREFAGLCVLPLSAAMRTALLREPEVGRAALRALPPLDLDRVLAALDAADARLAALGLLDALPTEAPPHDAAGGLPGHAMLPETARASGAHLALYRLARGEAPALDGPAQVRGWIELCANLLASPSVGAGATARPPGSGGARPRRGGGETGPRSDLSPLESPTPLLGDRPAITWLGGAFLLWPHLAAMPLERLTGSWRNLDAAMAAEALRWLALDRALGQSPAGSASSDPVLRAALVSHEVSEEVLGRCEGRARRTGPRAIAKALDPWFRAEGVATAEWQMLAGASRRSILKGDRQGYWLRVAGRPSPHGFTEGDAVAGIAATDGEDAALLLAPGAAVLPGQLAQIALRRFAWCIPGFAGASVAYLRENFLSMDAAITRSEGGVHASLGTAPVGILLNMAGITRQSYLLASGVTVGLSQGDRQ